MNQFVFDWWPDALAWLLLLEVVALATLGGFQILAKLLGRHEPHDFFVIFYFTFWRAFGKPRLYPTPVNYEPTPPRRDSVSVDMTGSTPLDDDDLDALLGMASAGGTATAGTEGDVEAMTVEVLVEGGAASSAVLAIESGLIRIAATVDAESGLANAAALKQVGLALGVPQHQLAIVSGQTKAEKTFRITGLTASELEDRLSSAAAACTPNDEGWGDDESVAFRT